MRAIIILAVLGVWSAAAISQTYAVGDTIPSDDVWAVTVQPDTLVTTDQVILLDWTGGGIRSVEAITDGSAKVWLYQLATSRVVLRRVGPQLLHDYDGARSLALPGMPVKAIELEDVVGDVKLHGRP